MHPAARAAAVLTLAPLLLTGSKGAIIYLFSPHGRTFVLGSSEVLLFEVLGELRPEATNYTNEREKST